MSACRKRPGGPSCPYAACLDICDDYPGIPRGLRRTNPKEYFRLYRQQNRVRLTEYQNEYNRVNREKMRPKWREQKRKERAAI